MVFLLYFLSYMNTMIDYTLYFSHHVFPSRGVHHLIKPRLLSLVVGKALSQTGAASSCSSRSNSALDH